MELTTPSEHMQLGKCVTGDTKIKIRNKQSGEIVELTIEQFHNLQKAKSNAKFLDSIKTEMSNTKKSLPKYKELYNSMLHAEDAVVSHVNVWREGISQDEKRRYIKKFVININKTFTPGEVVRCPLCGMGAGNLLKHYERTHGLTKPQCDELGYSVYSDCYLDGNRSRAKSPNNPWYNHGGKYSPYHVGSVNYNPESHRRAIEKSMMNPNNPFASTKIETYIRLGYSKEEATRIVSERQATFTYDKCLTKYGTETGIAVFRDRQSRWISNVFASLNRQFIPSDKLEHYHKYRAEAWQITRLNAKHVPNIQNRSREYHLDHKFSVYEGYVNNIPPEIIGSVCNLEIIPAYDNLSKGSSCSITVDELMRLYNETNSN